MSNKTETFATKVSLVKVIALRFDAKPSLAVRNALKAEGLDGEYCAKRNLWLVATDKATQAAEAVKAIMAEEASAQAPAPKASRKNANQMGASELVKALRAQGKTDSEIIAFLGA